MLHGIRIHSSDLALDVEADDHVPTLDLAVVVHGEEYRAVSLLNSFSFRAGDSTPTVSATTRHLLALLALREQPTGRLLVAMTLWPDGSEEQAASSLRSALYRLKGGSREAVIVAGDDISLCDDVDVDFRESKALARRLLDASEPTLPEDESAAAVRRLSVDLLTDWRQDWVVLESAEWHQLRLHALEAMAAGLCSKGRSAEAVVAAFVAVRAAPLRETARGALIKSFLVAGNQNEALDEFYRYRDLLQAELGIEPTSHLSNLVKNLRRRSTDN